MTVEPRVVEFVGLPGSGKSTTARRVAERVAATFVASPRHIQLESKIRWRLMLIFACIRNPGVAAVGLSGFSITGDPDFLRVGSMVAFITDRTADAGAGILEEGTRHYIASFFAERPELDIDRWIPRFARHLPPVSGFVRLECEHRTAGRRFAAREPTSGAHPGWCGVDSGFAARYRQALDHLLTVPVVIVNTTEASPDVVATQVIESLRTGDLIAPSEP